MRLTHIKMTHGTSAYQTYRRAKEDIMNADETAGSTPMANETA